MSRLNEPGCTPPDDRFIAKSDESAEVARSQSLLTLACVVVLKVKFAPRQAKEPHTNE